ncbi:MAG TPA: TPM domain-containing protein [Pyrinomonadaceae bacterium]|jgi:uncharacterized membrane protein YgcG
MKKAVIVIIITAAIIACKSGPTQRVSSVVAAVPSPSPVKAAVYVTDNAHVIDEATRKQLETTLAALKEHKKIDFSVVTITSIDDNPIYDYSLGLAQDRKKKRDSVEQNVAMLLLLVSVDDRKWHVQITRDLESHLTNEILRSMSIPMTDAFRQKQYGEGISKYVNAVIAKLDQLGIR